ncbi:family 1 glycosylhydrolase [Kitasatospora sp. NPDC127111]|uniref:family 1 glycosylhydrolase n=1 Tax=Kitasatospora sp. NPDC127111 TaxID=3345363 RepID=UPI00364421D4
MLCHGYGRMLSDDFLFGTSTSAHQTEGNNTNSDWWLLEHAGGRVTEPSGDGADSYHRWREDMDLLAGLGFTDYRFGIEWARIEPAPGRFSHAALAHYRRMVDGALERGLRPMVTLHHFTAPAWFADRGGWTAPGAVDLFARYVAETAPVIAVGVRHVCTIDEPNTAAALGARAASGAEALPPAGLPLPDERTTAALIEAHRRAFAVIRAVNPEIRIGWSVAGQVCQALPGAEEAAVAYRHPREDVFLEAARGDDWVGVQAHTRTLVGPKGPVPVPPEAGRTLTGREYYPAALGHALRHTAALAPGVPIIVTGNGVATNDDARRIAYTTTALADLAAAMTNGLDIRGYLHGSALDTYRSGSSCPAFGLISVEPKTFVRTPKPSATWLGGLARTRVLSVG